MPKKRFQKFALAMKYAYPILYGRYFNDDLYKFKILIIANIMNRNYIVVR